MLEENRRLELQRENLLRLAKHGEPKMSATWFPYTSGNEYLVDRESWGRSALRAHPEGLIRLPSGDEKARAKGEKILDIGYPHMKEEMIDRMKHEGFNYEGGNNGN